jgi:hypothetical protein
MKSVLVNAGFIHNHNEQIWINVDNLVNPSQVWKELERLAQRANFLLGLIEFWSGDFELDAFCEGEFIEFEAKDECEQLIEVESGELNKVESEELCA